jgi:F-type H+-transporting ATPase subunit epsilon
MNIQIITPDKTLFEGEAKLVQLPGLDGSFELLTNHAPMISALKEGSVKIKTDDDNEQFFEIRGGVVEVIRNKVLILAE